MSELFENLLTSSPFAVIELFQLKLETAIHGSNDDAPLLTASTRKRLLAK